MLWCYHERAVWWLAAGSTAIWPGHSYAMMLSWESSGWLAAGSTSIWPDWTALSSTEIFSNSLWSSGRGNIFLIPIKPLPMGTRNKTNYFDGNWTAIAAQIPSKYTRLPQIFDLIYFSQLLNWRWKDLALAKQYQYQMQPDQIAKILLYKDHLQQENCKIWHIIAIKNLAKAIFKDIAWSKFLHAKIQVLLYVNISQKSSDKYISCWSQRHMYPSGLVMRDKPKTAQLFINPVCAQSNHSGQSWREAN